MLGITWTAVTAAAMFALAAGKARTGKALGNPVPVTERTRHLGGRHPGGGRAGRTGVERGGWLVVADPLAALVIVFYALREALEIFLVGH